VGFHLIAAFDNSYVLGYPGLVMAYLGWIAGPICVGVFYVGSFYNNYLLATLHETGGKRHIRSRDLAGYILGMPAMLMEAATEQIHELLMNSHCPDRIADISLKSSTRSA
jgi:hypothetical protein